MLLYKKETKRFTMRIKMEIIWTVFGIVLSGVFVYAISEYIQETSLRRVREYQNIKRKVAYTLVMYACHYTNTID